jgi:hypothetical protein
LNTPVRHTRTLLPLVPEVVLVVLVLVLPERINLDHAVGR